VQPALDVGNTLINERAADQASGKVALEVAWANATATTPALVLDAGFCPLAQGFLPVLGIQPGYLGAHFTDRPTEVDLTRKINAPFRQRRQLPELLDQIAIGAIKRKPGRQRSATNVWGWLI
jgi:hypothetical protein